MVVKKLFLLIINFYYNNQSFSGLSLASIFCGEETVIQVTLASFYPILLMSGIIWPIEAQPIWLSNYISKFLPLTYATDSFRAILEKSTEFISKKTLLIYFNFRLELGK